MVSMMVRKATPVLAVAQATAPIPMISPPPTEMGEGVAGEAVSGGSLLDGMELDDEAVRSQQMLEQVSTLVKENPDAAATLVKRWLNRNVGDAPGARRRALRIVFSARRTWSAAQ